MPNSRFRPSSIALLIFAVLLLNFVISVLDAAWRSQTVALVDKRTLVKELGLSDLALFTEARYTRHPSQADRHSAFQDHPGALEHFPSGSLFVPLQLQHSAAQTPGQ